MGQQQILLIILGVILVGIAITVGITMFNNQARQGNIDAIISDLNNLAVIAFQYRIRPISLRGGGGSFLGGEPGRYIDFADFFYDLPEGLIDNMNGKYTIFSCAENYVIIQGVSKTQKDPDGVNGLLTRWIRVDDIGSTELYLTEPSDSDLNLTIPTGT
jgi:hypothetical protein